MRQQRTGLMIAGLAALVAVTLVLVAMALKHGRGVTGSVPAVTQPAAPTAPASTSTTAATTPTIAIVGGAMTYANSTSATSPGNRSWVTYFQTGDTPKKLFMKDGLTSQQATSLLTGGPFQALVVATADDDYAAGRTGQESAEDIAGLVSKAKTPAAGVFVVAMSPASAVPGQQITTFNAALEKAVKAKGWGYCDAWSPVRGDDGQWADESQDSVKNGNGASPATAKKVGPAVLACLTPDSASATSTATS